jgi:hypothetical protein
MTCMPPPSGRSAPAPRERMHPGLTRRRPRRYTPPLSAARAGPAAITFLPARPRPPGPRGGGNIQGPS